MRNLEKIEKIISLYKMAYPTSFDDIEKIIKTMSLKDRYELLQYVRKNNQSLIEFIENKIFHTELNEINLIKSYVEDRINLLEQEIFFGSEMNSDYRYGKKESYEEINKYIKKHIGY